VLSSGDRYGVALEALIRTESLRRDFRATIPSEKSWPAQLGLIEHAVQRCINVLNVATAKDEEADQRECSRDIEVQFNNLKASIDSYGAGHSLKQVLPPETRGSFGYQVRVTVAPPKAKVRVITYLQYKKYQYLHTPEGEYQWIDLVGSESEMIGLYHYRAEWPPELNGPEEGNFEITGPKALTFTPPAVKQH
jgi:hypothetical protein